jgi:hypothetical protein
LGSVGIALRTRQYQYHESSENHVLLYLLYCASQISVDPGEVVTSVMLQAKRGLITLAARFAREVEGCVITANTITAPWAPPAEGMLDAGNQQVSSGDVASDVEDAFLAMMEANFTVGRQYTRRRPSAVGTGQGADSTEATVAPAPAATQPLPPQAPPAAGPSSPPRLIMPSGSSNSSGARPSLLPRPSPRSAYLLQTQATAGPSSPDMERLPTGT